MQSTNSRRVYSYQTARAAGGLQPLPALPPPQPDGSAQEEAPPRLGPGEMPARMKALSIPIADIRTNGEPARGAKRMQALCDSIREVGLLQPILVRREVSGYSLLAGSRRLEACKRLGLHRVDAVVMQLSQEEASLAVLAENLHREPWHFTEEAEAYDAALRSGVTTYELVNRLGVNQATLAQRLRLTRLPAETRRLIRELDLSERYAKMLLRLGDDNQVRAAARRMIDKQLTPEDAQAMVEAMASERPGQSAGPNGARRIIGAVRDTRPYLNALRDVVQQLHRGGMPATMEVEDSRKEKDCITVTITMPKL